MEAGRLIMGDRSGPARRAPASWGVREAETYVKLRFISRSRLVVWMPILRRALYLPTTEVNSSATPHRNAGGALCPTTLPLHFQIAVPVAMVDCLTIMMKQCARRSVPPMLVAPAIAADAGDEVVVFVVDGDDAATKKTMLPRCLDSGPFRSCALAMPPVLLQSSLHALVFCTTQGRSAAASGLVSAPAVDSTTRCCARTEGTETAVTSSGAVPAAGALVLSASAETPLLRERAS